MSTARELVKDYRDEARIGYVIESSNDGSFRYLWVEGGVFEEGLWYPTLVGALRAAADDWDECGSAFPRCAAVLRGVATREERKGQKR